MNPAEGKIVSVTPGRKEDQAFLMSCGGCRFASVGLPSGDEVAAVEGHRWRVEVVQNPFGPFARLVLEIHPGKGEG